MAALQVLGVVQSEGKAASEVCSGFEPVPQILKNVRYEHGKPLEDKAVMEAIDHGNHILAKSGRLVIRPSGTEPLIRVMAEGDDQGMIEDVVDDIVGALSSIAA